MAKRQSATAKPVVARTTAKAASDQDLAQVSVRETTPDGRALSAEEIRIAKILKMGKRVMVRAKGSGSTQGAVGYYGEKRRYAGEVFQLTPRSQYDPSWMELVHGATPARTSSVVEERRKQHRAVVERRHNPPSIPSQERDDPEEAVATGGVRAADEDLED